MTDNEYKLIELDKQIRHNEIVRQINEQRRVNAETSRLETLDKRIEEALEYSGISYADPIEWDNRRNFKSGTVTIYEGDSYLSKKFVPIGTPITDRDYWLPISATGVLYQRIIDLIGPTYGMTKAQMDEMWTRR